MITHGVVDLALCSMHWQYKVKAKMTVKSYSFLYFIALCSLLCTNCYQPYRLTTLVDLWKEEINLPFRMDPPKRERTSSLHLRKSAGLY